MPLIILYRCIIVKCFTVKIIILDDKRRNCVVGRLLPTASARVSGSVSPRSIVLNQTMVAHPQQFILAIVLALYAGCSNKQ